VRDCNPNGRGTSTLLRFRNARATAAAGQRETATKVAVSSGAGPASASLSRDRVRPRAPVLVACVTVPTVPYRPSPTSARERAAAWLSWADEMTQPVDGPLSLKRRSADCSNPERAQSPSRQVKPLGRGRVGSVREGWTAQGHVQHARGRPRVRRTRRPAGCSCPPTSCWTSTTMSSTRCRPRRVPSSSASRAKSTPSRAATS